MRPVLISVGDDSLADEVLRVALLAGVAAARVGSEPTRAVGSLVVCDAESLSASPRGDQLLLVGQAPFSAQALAAALDAGACGALVLPADEARLSEVLTRAGRSAEVGPLRGVVGATGGVGASTFAAALAQASDGLLVDLDRWGSGLDALLGLDTVAGPRWSALVAAHGRLDAAALREALPSLEGVPVLGNDGVEVSPLALAAVVAAGREAGAAVVLDLPPSAIAVLVNAGVRLTQGLVMVRDDVAGVLAARRVVASLRVVADDVALVLIRVTGAVEPALATRVLDAPVIARIAIDPRLRRRARCGGSQRPTAPVLRAARALLAAR